MLKNVERKCPYCPDRFHNGIGLANHVRGHLNRVGVSYNVRHFISPEEVNAIERKFSYQKKRKKGEDRDGEGMRQRELNFSGSENWFKEYGLESLGGRWSHSRFRDCLSLWLQWPTSTQTPSASCAASSAVPGSTRAPACLAMRGHTCEISGSPTGRSPSRPSTSCGSSSPAART